MKDPALKIFSYLPNPRVWKAQIAAELCGTSIELVGGEPKELVDWLWDADARLLTESERSTDHPAARRGRRGFTGTLYKTDAFLKAHPFGTVPAGFSPGDGLGIFESNSIMRAVVLASDSTTLYGHIGYERARIDSFLDATLIFAREAQVYLLALPTVSSELSERMRSAYEFYLSGINSSLRETDYIAGDELTVADIAFCCDYLQFLKERRSEKAVARRGLSILSRNADEEYPEVAAHVRRLVDLPAFARHVEPLVDLLEN